MTYGHRATEINRLHRGLDYARSEAVLRGLTVALCTKQDGRQCTTAGDWDDGWIIFVDRNADLDREADETLLRSKRPFADDNRLQGNRLLAHHLGYQRRAFSKAYTTAPSPSPPPRAIKPCAVVW
ncbi:MAG: GspH/FimT family protein [Gammaproteobacteria bacterium]